MATNENQSTASTSEVSDLESRMGSMKIDLDTNLIVERDELFQALVSDHPVALGKAASSKERDEKGLKASTLVYGEINFPSFAIAFEKIKKKYGGLQKAGGKFYDVGSGTGKPAFAAALLHPFDEVVGIEILSGLYDISLELLAKWKEKLVPKLDRRTAETNISFVNGDITKEDWSDADLWFANSTCFNETLMTAMAKVADKCAVGTFGITFTKRLPSKKYEVLESEVHQMSWGSATVFIHKKIA